MLALALVCSASIQGNRISLSLPAETADKTIATLSKALGKPLTCGRAVSGEIVLLRVKDATAEEVEARLAAALDAVWVKSGDHETLDRPREFAKLSNARELQARAERLAAAAKKQPAPPVWSDPFVSTLLSNISSAATDYALAPLRDDSRAASRLNGLGRQAPIGRALARIIPLLDMRGIAKLSYGEQLVLSNDPTSVEVQLPREADKVLAAFNEEQRTFAAAFDSLSRSELSPLDPRYGVSAQHPAASRFVVKVRRWYRGDSLSIVLFAVAPGGWILGRHVGIISPAAIPDLPDLPHSKIAITPEEIEYGELLETIGYPQARTPFGRDRAAFLGNWAERLTHPEASEPLSFRAGRVLEQIGDATGKNIVACIPDQALNWSTGWKAGDTFEPGSMLKRICSDWCASVKFAGDWIEVRPTDPFLERRERLDRGVLGRLLRTIHSEGRLRLDVLADYADRQTGSLCLHSLDADMMGLAGGYAGEFSPRDRGSSELRPALRVWGSLSPEQRRSLRAGGDLSAAFAGAAVQRRMSEMLYSAYFPIQPPLAGHDTTPPDASYVYGNIESEPCEACPDGLQAQAALHSIGENEILLLESAADGSWADASTPESIGDSRAYAPGFAKQPEVSYRIGSAAVVKLRLLARPDMWIDARLGEQGDKWGERVTYDQLPADITRRIEAETKSRLQKGGQAKPPPR